MFRNESYNDVIVGEKAAILCSRELESKKMNKMKGNMIDQNVNFYIRW